MKRKDAQLYIDVNYEQRHRAKDLGAKWDADMRQWYVPHGKDVHLFIEWWPAHLRFQIAKTADPQSNAVKAAQRKAKLQRQYEKKIERREARRAAEAAVKARAS